MSIIQNITQMKNQIARAAEKAGRDVNDIRLIAVSKTVNAARVQEAVDAGICDLGENRVQELMDKYPLVEGARWHLIGHLQTNKVKYIVGKVALVHSLDRWSLALELDKRAREAGVVIPVLVQVNVAGEETKFGLAVPEVRDFVTEAAALTGISIEGLMTIAPLVENPEEVRPVFRELKRISEGLKDIPGVRMEQLSMGMSNDFAVAIEEGATMIRIGTAIFGSRK
ncbi:YggS family pyridoxal phosphate-dependent enzyme [Desulforamulus ferrireducens]|uniref:Pyridoxal phosphate homeostasis protein n=1 Tax=Desulforamulus ferrireducens TaxID=1833852 RepID=A0A1S6IU79_9FIRM|nr:YggS family pyridoxal phosphate-dependent enzyme [Desulforamulus ferrireducens]AQS58331.1 YggS family pyridoxal phosphate enzyme [Desulforamulus ferrireducens]